MCSAIKRFAKRNKVLLILFLIASCITLSYYITYDMPEIIPGIEKWYKLSSDLSVGVIINFIFYIFQVYIPRRDEEKKSLLIIEPDLTKIFECMQETNLVVQTFLPGFKDGKILITENSVYYLKIPTENPESGWARHFDLYKDFSSLKRTIVNTTDKLLSLPLIQECDKEIIDLLSRLQSNGFLRTLEIAEKSEYNPSYCYGDLGKSYPDFCDLFEKLKGFVREYKTISIRPLTKDEIIYFENEAKAINQTNIGVIHVRIKNVVGVEERWD